MSIENPVYLAASTMVTPVGGNTIMTAAAINVGASQIAETAILNKRLKPIKMALVPETVLPPLNPEILAHPLPARQLRLLQLAAVGLSQLAGQMPVGQSLPLFLSLPEQLPSLSKPLIGNFIKQLIIQTDFPLDSSQSRVAHVGRSGGIYAIDAAHRYLAEEGHDYVLVGGVDTYCDPDLLARLDAEDRLMGQGALDGFFPGEGAAFLLLASERVKSQLPSPLIALAKPGLADEPGHRYSDEPYRGEGLAAAVTQACSHAPGMVDNIWTSMIYDGFASKELGVAFTRNSKSISPAVKMYHPVDCVGDMGAAISCALIGLTGAAAQRTRKSSHHLVCCSSELSHRGAIRLDVIAEG